MGDMIVKLNPEPMRPPIEGQLYGKVWAFDDYTGDEPERQLGVPLEEANVITSKVAHGGVLHKAVLDIDFPVIALESSTPGHAHLIIDKAMTWDKYVNLMRILVDCGLMERGFMQASVARGYTAVRLPWVKKTAKQEAQEAGL